MPLSNLQTLAQWNQWLRLLSQLVVCVCVHVHSSGTLINTARDIPPAFEIIFDRCVCVYALRQLDLSHQCKHAHPLKINMLWRFNISFALIHFRHFSLCRTFVSQWISFIHLFVENTNEWTEQILPSYRFYTQPDRARIKVNGEMELAKAKLIWDLPCANHFYFGLLSRNLLRWQRKCSVSFFFAGCCSPKKCWNIWNGLSFMAGEYCVGIKWMFWRHCA